MEQRRAQRRKYHYIYKITCFDGKYYIGMHSTDNLDDDYFGSGKRLLYSINKHGKDKHSKEILEFLLDRETLKFREKELITEEMRLDKLCMNIAPGGGGGFINEEHRKAFRAGNSKGGKTSHARYGKEWRQKGQGLGGKISIKTNRLLTLTRKAREKRKDTMASRGHMQGEKNSQFGTCWIVKNAKPIKIKREQLEEYIANGYLRGRK